MKRQRFCLNCNNLYLLCENNHKNIKQIKQIIAKVPFKTSKIALNWFISFKQYNAFFYDSCRI